MTRTAFSLAAALLLAAGTNPATAADAKGASDNAPITLSGAFALYPMAVKWAEEYKKLNPGVKIDISGGGAGKGMADALSGIVDIGMVSRELNPAEFDKGAFKISVAKDAVVPVANAKNPAVKEILAKGLKKDAFVSVWITEKATKWSDLIPGAPHADLHTYTRADACGAAETWALFLGKKQEDLAGTGVNADPGIAEAVRADVLGIGYNNIGFAYDAKTGAQVAGLCVIPIDLNGDGTIDKDENFYATMPAIVKAIADGKYPSPPARDLHFVTKGKPQREAVLKFIRWSLTDGQKFVNEAGYIGLGDEKLKAELKKLE